MMVKCCKIAVALAIRPSLAYVPSRTTRIAAAFSVHCLRAQPHHKKTRKLCASLPLQVSSSSVSSTSDGAITIAKSLLRNGVSRLETLQKLLSKHGAPGSAGCNTSGGDLTPVGNPWCENLHPLLLPISKSRSSGKYICALTRVSPDEAEDTSAFAPMPIVESAENSPGMRLLALNSEHIMRRIACEADFSGSEDKNEILSLYNEGLGLGELSDKGLDTPYATGSVAKLGYGVEKYVLLRVGPFPDLYEAMARQHLLKGDESSALIAAETSNGKFPGFGSTFAFFAQLLSDMGHSRNDEARDAARLCFRLPLSTAGMTEDDFIPIARNAGLFSDLDEENVVISAVEAFAKMQVVYEKILEHEKDGNQSDSGKTTEQIALDEAKYLLDTVTLTGGEWGIIRTKLGDLYQKAGKETIAILVDPSRS